VGANVKLVATKYVIPGQRDVAVEMREMSDDGQAAIAWAVTGICSVLSTNLRWEYEPAPSSRTEEFIKRTRFSSPEEALGCYQQYLDKNRS
jgi:hypothetical protein